MVKTRYVESADMDVHAHRRDAELMVYGDGTPVRMRDLVHVDAELTRLYKVVGSIPEKGRVVIMPLAGGGCMRIDPGRLSRW
mgnify:CR=1 FL=1